MIVSIAAADAASGTLSCTDFYEIAISDAANLVETGEQIAAEATNLLRERLTYAEVGACTGLVIKAYEGAGINLPDLARQNGTGDPRYVPHLFALGEGVGLPAGIRGAGEVPLAGDIVFLTILMNEDGVLSMEGGPLDLLTASCLTKNSQHMWRLSKGSRVMGLSCLSMHQVAALQGVL